MTRASVLPQLSIQGTDHHGLHRNRLIPGSALYNVKQRVASSCGSFLCAVSVGSPVEISAPPISSTAWAASELRLTQPLIRTLRSHQIRIPLQPAVVDSSMSTEMYIPD